eukprot:scaffold2727_cov275-Chaetoceros_neogracile.AAC.8
MLQELALMLLKGGTDKLLLMLEPELLVCRYEKQRKKTYCSSLQPSPQRSPPYGPKLQTGNSNAALAPEFMFVISYTDAQPHNLKREGV